MKPGEFDVFKTRLPSFHSFFAAPDFSKPTHARFRAKLAKLVALAEAGDVEGLKAIEINPVSTSPKAMARYRDLAIFAIEVQGKSA